MPPISIMRLNLDAIRFLTCGVCDGEVLPLAITNEKFLPDEAKAICGFCMWRFNTWRNTRWHRENEKKFNVDHWWNINGLEYDDQIPDDVRLAEFLAIELKNAAQGKKRKKHRLLETVDGELQLLGKLRRKTSA